MEGFVSNALNWTTFLLLYNDRSLLHVQQNGFCLHVEKLKYIQELCGEIWVTIPHTIWPT